MKIDRPELRDEFKRAARCEYCWKPNPQGCDPHHVPSRGAGGSDFRCMLMAVCRECHSTKVDSKNGRAKCLRIIAMREGVSVTTLIEVHDFIRRLDKLATADGIEIRMMDELTKAAQRLCRKMLKEVGKC